MASSGLVQKLAERSAHTLYVKLPFTIKDKKDVEKFFVGVYHIKLPRQSSRYCHVVFTNKEDTQKNLALIKGKTVNGKRIIVSPAPSKTKDKKVRNRKKIIIPKPTPEVPVTQILHVSNIKHGVKTQDIQGAFLGCTNVTFLRSYAKDVKSAIVKLDSIAVAAEYLTKKRDAPILQGKKLILNPDTRGKNVNKIKLTKNKRKAKIKIYN